MPIPILKSILSFLSNTEPDVDGDLFSATPTWESDLDSELLALESSVDGGGKGIPIWAEENGSLSTPNNSGDQFSFGNGSTGTIGIPIVGDWTLYAFSFNAETYNAGATCSIAIIDRATGTTITTVPITSNNQIVQLSLPILEGTTIGFKTTAISGTITDVRVCAWIQ